MSSIGYSHVVICSHEGSKIYSDLSQLMRTTKFIQRDPFNGEFFSLDKMMTHLYGSGWNENLFSYLDPHNLYIDENNYLHIVTETFCGDDLPHYLVNKFPNIEIYFLYGSDENLQEGMSNDKSERFFKKMFVLYETYHTKRKDLKNLDKETPLFCTGNFEDIKEYIHQISGCLISSETDLEHWTTLYKVGYTSTIYIDNDELKI